MNRMHVLMPLAGAAASALLLSACGSSGVGSTVSGSGAVSSSSSSTPTSPATSSTAETSSAASGGSSATKAQLAAINVRAGDLPAGFVGKPAEADSGDDGVNAQLESCTGVQGAPDSHKVATADSDDFSKGQLTVSSSFSSFQSESDVAADVALIKSPKINDCLNTVFKSVLTQSIGSEGTITGASLKLTPGSNGGPSNVAGLASGVVTFTASGQKATIYLGVAFITGPKIDGTLSYFGIGQPLDTATQISALTAVAKRAANP